MLQFKTFPPKWGTFLLPRSSTGAHRCGEAYATLLPLLLPAPLSTAKKEIIQFKPFSKNTPLPSPPLPTANGGTQTTTLTSQTLIVCACVCIFFSLTCRRKPSEYLFLVLLSGSTEPFESHFLTEKVQVAEFSSEKLLDLGKFGFWILKPFKMFFF